ncbi:arginine--tRNA ligase [Thermostilla marina]
MNILNELKARFADALRSLSIDPGEYLDLVRQSQDPKFGDYQANFAMPLGKRLGKNPRELAGEVVSSLKIDDLAAPPEVAGPGFINVRLQDAWLEERLNAALHDERLGVTPAAEPKTYVVDYSAPNVAKPMHVGHIRSTVIGDSICRTLRFLGHRVISDNHIGDWGTQFGMIIYGYKHFRDEEAYRNTPVAELARLYRLVRQLMDYHAAKERIDDLRAELPEREAQVAKLRKTLDAAEGKERKKAKRDLQRAETHLAALRETIEGLESKIAAVEGDADLAAKAAAHPNIGEAVLEETAKLHAGDPENVRLWKEFLPHSLDEINRIYRRLGVSFDHTLGESFYHDRLKPLVDELLSRGIAKLSDGAVCIFFDDIDVPMIVRKKDGAFLYATTDLATLAYRMETWRPDAILYVVDHRQSLHFTQLFTAARMLGFNDVELVHVAFGTVLGNDGRPFKTRSGDTVALEGLLDEAVRRAGEIVAANDDAKPNGPELSPEERRRVAEVVGIGALKYADLSQNRTSDYVFSYDKMLAMNGNTGTYMQYAYARIRNIFAKGGIDIDALRKSAATIHLREPAERALGLELLRFSETLEMVPVDYRPNVLTGYLYDLAARFTTFYENCPVLKAEDESVRNSRLLLCDLTARVIRQGLDLLGIQVVDRM